LTRLWHQPFIRAMTLLSGASALVLPGSTLIVIVLAQQQHASAVIIGQIFAAGALLLSLLEPGLHYRPVIIAQICQDAFFTAWTVIHADALPMPQQSLVKIVDSARVLRQ
jgi:hypothetical protein